MRTQAHLQRLKHCHLPNRISGAVGVAGAGLSKSHARERLFSGFFPHC